MNVQAGRVLEKVDETLEDLHLRRIKRVLVAVIGGTVLLVGFCLLILPGPAILVIPLGLTILASEFVWARRWLRKARDLLNRSRGDEPKRKGA
jgi:Putative transmembrane protein (PGPGW)